MILPIPIIMVSGGGLAEGREIRLGALMFIADDSLGSTRLHSTSRRSPSTGRRTSAHASAASFFDSRRLSISRLLRHPRFPLFAGVSDPVSHGFSGG